MSDNLTELLNTHIAQAIDTLTNGLGSGLVAEHRLRTVLERMAHRVAVDAGNDALMTLRTADELADELGVSPRRMRAIIRNRHERFGVGWQVPGTNQWLVRPSEVESLRPDVRYRRKSTSD